MVPFVTVDGSSLPVVREFPDSLQVQTSVHLVTLLLDAPEAWAERWGVKALPSQERVLLRHGRNTVSYIDADGAWIACGPWPALVARLAHDAFDLGHGLAMASVRDQWRFRPDGLERAIGRLTVQVCRQIPRWTALERDRQATLTTECEALVRQFLGTCSDPYLPERFEASLEPYPGLADIPVQAIRGGPTAVADVEAVEADLRGAFQPSRTALDYWWQSVFTMWWKGFW